MRRIFPLVLAAALLVASLASCMKKDSGETMTPEARTTLYQTAIESARDQETNDAYAVLTNADDPSSALIFELLGVTAEDMTAYALSVSPVNITAYGIAAILPAAGREDAVRKGLEGFIDRQQESFQQYLVDQYDIATSARLETLKDGTILLVMDVGQDALFDSIRASIEAGNKK